MKTKLHLALNTRKRGLALIMVVSCLALLTVLMLALFSTTENEFKATSGFVAGQNARLLADSATNIVMGQLQKAVKPNTSGTSRTIHATQPGAVRSYAADGTFRALFKMYSSHEMEIRGNGPADEAKINSDLPPTDWNTKPARYVDLNEPIVRVGASAALTELSFPIIDPTAYTKTTSPAPVEGFIYSDKALDDKLAGTGSQINGVVLPTASSSSALNQRLPMPVEWLYVLQDGSLGAISDATNEFMPAAGGSAPTIDNPIVGRIAFWTDDECCKVNINTASEPTFWGTPRFYHEREHEWAEKPPTASEYQRFPGHPATVALSTVLFPGQDFDTHVASSSLYNSKIKPLIVRKERLYDIIPKIARGGSVGGTKFFQKDDQPNLPSSGLASSVDPSRGVNERLYATLDELLFSEDLDASGKNRLTNNDQQGADGSAPITIVDRALLERSRFFLTASSRAPEFSILGTPKIAMWPLSTSLDSKHRTPYDNLIAFCSTLKGQQDNNYYFQRQKAHDATYDIASIGRNAALMKYLLAMVGKEMPKTGTGTGAAKTLAQKYGDDNIRSTLVEIFDYIRSTNLYDNILSANNNLSKKSLSSPGPNDPYGYRNNPTDIFTYTDALSVRTRTKDSGGNALQPSQQQQVADNGWPGHGTVTPSLWQPQGSTKYRGMGRFFTLSEIGLQFICTADGRLDDNSFKIPGYEDKRSGGASAWRLDPTILDPPPPAPYQNEGISSAYPYLGNGNAYWWSNFPPKPPANAYGTSVGAPDKDPRNPNKHPGYDPKNWNVTLENGKPLAEDQRRVGAMLDLEMFCPSEGWTLLHPEWTVVLDGTFINGITVEGQNVFRTDSDIVLKSSNNVFQANNVYSSGGTVTPGGVLDGKKLKGVGNMPPDPGYVGDPPSNGHDNLDDCGLASNFFTVDVGTDPANPKPMHVAFTGPPLVVKLYDSHDYLNHDPVQIIKIDFNQINGASVEVPPPSLVKTSSQKRSAIENGVLRIYNAVEAPHWWAFHKGGALGRWKKRGPVTPENIDSWGYAETDASITERTGGRLNGVAGNTDLSLITSGDVIRSVIPALGDYRVLMARYEVPPTMWQLHPKWGDNKVAMAHNFSGHDSAGIAGFDAGSPPLQFMDSVSGDYKSKNPDLPRSTEALNAVNSLGDFDNGQGNTRDGAYCNKPDEGNFATLNFVFDKVGVRLYRSSYFFSPWEFDADRITSNSYFTPNRLVSSPVMFGSLPSAAFSGSALPGSGTYTPNTGGRPWQTLLFRPHSQSSSVSATHQGADNPPDHYLLDLFNMPVVEPYAISEPLSEAGKINLNYQIVPFTYISRATALHSVLKGQLMRAVPSGAVAQYKAGGTKPNTTTFPPVGFWEESGAASPTNSPSNNGYCWHRKINAEETVKQLAERFLMNSGLSANRKGLLRSASQVCELHMIPKDAPAGVPGINVPATFSGPSDRDMQMSTFWKSHALTGDNSREEIYTNIYPKLTTRSNTFRVHMRTQVIKKARSTSPTTFDPNKDKVVSEFRGSQLLERFIDPNTTTIEDYTIGDPLSHPSLDSYYQFRVLETKRFAP